MVPNVKRRRNPLRKAQYAKDHARTAVVLERQRRVLELRKRGYTYAQIAKAESIAVSVAFNDVWDALEDLHPLEQAQDVLKLELTRLDRYQKALDVDAMKGDPRAILAAVKLMDRRARYIGIDAPQRHEHGGPGGGPIEVKDVGKMSEAELRAYLVANGINPGPEPPTSAG